MKKYILVLLAGLLGGAVSTVEAKPGKGGGHGCQGASFGCYGVQVGFGCQGGYAWGAGCQGGFALSPMPSGCHGCYGGMPATYFSFGLRSAYPVVNGPIINAPPVIPAPQPPVITNGIEAEVNGQPPPAAPINGNSAVESLGLPEEKAQGPAPATLVVQLPAEATLTVNGVATRSTAAKRVFTSPPLERDREFHYTLKAECSHNGQTLVATQRIALRGGQEKTVVLEFAPPPLTEK